MNTNNITNQAWFKPAALLASVLVLSMIGLIFLGSQVSGVLSTVGASVGGYPYEPDPGTDGNTAGQSVYSPVNGTIRWTEAGSGGISIDLGNGYAAAIFHITVDPSLSCGDPLTQGSGRRGNAR